MINHLNRVTGGELFDLINAKGLFEESEALPLVKQMLECLVYLHSNGIAHRDLKVCCWHSIIWL